MSQDTTSTKVNESNWDLAVQWWQSKYPNTEPLKTFPKTKEGHSDVVMFLEKAKWSQETIDNFKRQSPFF